MVDTTLKLERIFELCIQRSFNTGENQSKPAVVNS
jgi:hypothetical protein